jgi:two-component system, cell cycle response regulator
VGREDHDRELTLLRRRLAVLTEEARKNDDAWRRAQAREMELLEADTLDALLERLTNGLRESYRLEASTLVVADLDHEIRRLLSFQGATTAERNGVLFVDSVHGVAPAVAAGRQPWLGKFNRANHALLFPATPELQSVALLPLTRQERLIGCLNFGSCQRERFQAALGTEFLHHLGLIAAFALESAVNRARLVRSGFTDVLTGWHNRRYLQSRLFEELARCKRERTPLTCLMIDVDHFKSVNDRFGHLAGDEVLRQLADRISGEVRGSDVSARYGGEEFVVLLPGTGVAAGFVLAERIRAAVAAEPFELTGDTPSLPVTVSIGVADHSPNADEHDLKVVGERLLALADVALYEAKAGGRNAVAQAANS